MTRTRLLVGIRIRVEESSIVPIAISSIGHHYQQHWSSFSAALVIISRNPNFVKVGLQLGLDDGLESQEDRARLGLGVRVKARLRGRVGVRSWGGVKVRVGFRVRIRIWLGTGLCAWMWFRVRIRVQNKIRIRISRVMVEVKVRVTHRVRVIGLKYSSKLGVSPSRMELTWLLRGYTVARVIQSFHIERAAWSSHGSCES